MQNDQFKLRMIKWLNIFVFCFLPQALSAQGILRLQHLNVADGLSQSSVYNIFQDSHGFMWLATGDGLNRYDGKEFTVFKSRLNDTGNTQLLDRNLNSALFEDRNHKLWMSSDEGISFFDYVHARFRTVLNTYTIAFCIDSGYVWSWTVQNGLHSVDLNSYVSAYYPFTDKYQTDKSRMYGIQNAIADAGSFWIADAAGLLQIDRKSKAGKRAWLHEGINSVFGLSDGKLLLTGTGGIWLYDTAHGDTSWIPINKQTADHALSWKWCTQDTVTGNVYLAAQNDGTICNLNLKTKQFQFIDFQNNLIYCLYIDHSRNLWIGTDGNGIFRLDIKPPKFSCYAPGLQGQQSDGEGLMVKSIFRDDTGLVWIGSFYKGLLKYDPGKQYVRNAIGTLPSVHKKISVIMKDSSGLMLVAADARVHFIDPASERILAHICLQDDTVKQRHEAEIYGIAEWKKNHFVVATSSGMYSVKYENGKAERLFHFTADTDIYSWQYALYNSGNGSLYLGKRNRNGFAEFKMISDTTLTVLDKGFNNLVIRNFYKCAHYPVVWMASDKGLIAYNQQTKRYKVFDENAGLANSYIYCILARSDSLLWVSTNRGLASVRVTYDSATAVRAEIVNYNAKDGLQSDEFNTGAGFRSPDGTMYFGGIAGINWFDPDKIKTNPFPPQAAITKILINDKLLPGDTAAYITSLTLPYNSNTIGFTFAALEFTIPEKNQFAYKLEGLDRDWVYTTNDKVRYSGLSPGRYIFLLKASNDDLIWNNEPLKIELTILPPFWQTWWFRSFVLLFVAGATLVAIRIYINRKVNLKTRELARQQALYVERLRISKDVHDDLGSGLSKISLMSELARQKASELPSLEHDIRKISGISKELIDNMRDLVWVLNPENASLEQLAAHIREYSADYLDNTPIRISFDFPDSIPGLQIGGSAQRSLFLTIKEALNNTVKHSGASLVNITLRLDAGQLTITITDNGKGVAEHQPARVGNGLNNMRQRTESIGGTFVFASEPGKTIIEVKVPLSGICL